MRQVWLSLARLYCDRDSVGEQDARASGSRAHPVRRLLDVACRHIWLAVLGTIVALPTAWHISYGLAYWLYSAPLAEGLPFRAGFETADLSEWSSSGAKQLCCAHSAKIVTEPVRSGRHALKVTLDSGDPLVKSSKRAEFRLKAAYKGRSYRYALSLFVPEAWNSTPDTVLFAQWHSVPDKLLGEGELVPPLSIGIEGDQFQLKGTWDADLISAPWFSEGGADVVNEPYVWTAPLERGQWIDWAVGVRWSDDHDGYLELWKDNKVVFRREGPNMFNDLLGPYLKIGVYIPNWKGRYEKFGEDHDRRSLYFDAVEVVEEDLPFASAQRPPKHIGR